MKKLLIIGGSGFVGSRLIDSLIGSWEIVNLDIADSNDFDSLSVVCDVEDADGLLPFFEEVDTVILLAAEHRDDVTPKSRYYSVNVQGMQNVLRAMDANGVNNIIFTSSVAIYGMNHSQPPMEDSPAVPFNDYGKSKWEAEQVLLEWSEVNAERNALILRPTVIFGEKNRGNVYNLLKQIYTGKFIMIGSGNNKKSLAYVGNVVAFIKYKLEKEISGLEVFNYVDKPDFDMNGLIAELYRHKGVQQPKFRVPYVLGLLGGYCFDVISRLRGKKMTISSVRVKKFCSSTEINSDKLDSSGFVRPTGVKDGLRKTLSAEF